MSKIINKSLKVLLFVIINIAVNITNNYIKFFYKKQESNKKIRAKSEI